MAHCQIEIESIKKKIAENEKLLSHIKGSPTETAKAVNRRDGSEDGCGCYVYGIVGSDGSRPLDLSPEEGVAPTYPLYALPYRSIQAIVSKSPLEEFGQEAIEANLNDVQWLAAKACAHESVLDGVLADRTVVPMRFCTIYHSEGRVREMLARYYDDFVDALARLEGKREWGGKCFCDRETLARQVAVVSDSVQEMKAEISRKSGGAAYFLKKKLEEMIAEESERVSGECAQRSHDRLSSHAGQSVINPLQAEEMILNGAYLVAEERLPAFRAESEALQGEYGRLGFSYRMTGPWPPYNFVTIGAGEVVADESVSD